MERMILKHKISIEKVSNLSIEHNLEVHSLAPTDKLDEGANKKRYAEYEKRLVSALRRPNITNIAITGTYGSGKSSVLNTFKRRSNNICQWNFLDISLSTFQINENNEVTNTLEPDQIQLIERSILQQFFYAVPQAKIPLSRFKRITEEGKISKLLYIIIIILFISSSLLIFDKIEFIEAIYPQPSWLPKASIWIFTSCLLAIIYKVINTTFELSEIKLNFHDSEFNIKNEKEKSILNDHLDEILYFFDTTKKNVVIIEDLDRFNNNEIFIRLRELNLIVNKYCNHKVVFIYAIKDDMFKDKDRTKFFEYIIPIIPVINPSNSFNWIQDNHKETIAKINKKFLRNICFYFDDLRLVKNIFNEYQLYKENLKELHLDDNILFSIIVYKNKYPNDFSNLHINKGDIYDAFNSYKSNLIVEKTEELIKKSRDIIGKIDELESESIENIDELNSIYAGMLFSYITNKIKGENILGLFTIYSGDKEFEIHEINTSIFFESLIQGNNLQYYFRGYNYGYRKENINFKEVEKSVSSTLSYEQRLDNITSKKNGAVENLNKERKAISSKIKSIEMLRLSDFDKHEGLLEDKPLLRFLIINGYIDENYYKYISYFSDSDITLDEQNYLIQISEQRDPSFDINITNPNIMLSDYIGIRSFLSSSSLNFHILDYLLNNQLFTPQLKYLLDNITNSSYQSFEFMSQYIQRNRNLILFIPLLIANRETVIEDLQIGFDDEDSYYNLTKVITYLPLEQLEASNYLNSKLKNILENYSDYIGFILECFDKNEDKFKEFSSILKPKITNISYTSSHSELINWLGSNDYLSININLIRDAIDCMYPLPDASVHQAMHCELKEQPFTFLSSLEETYLPLHLWSEKLPLYIDEFLNNLEEGEFLIESESILIKILKSEDINSNQINELIQVVSTKISDITKVDIETHLKLFQYNVALANWHNVMTKFIEGKGILDKALIDFINLNFEALGEQYNIFKQNNPEMFEADRNFETALIECNELDECAYKEILSSSDSEWIDIDISKLEKNKIFFLISNNLFGLNIDNWQSVIAFDDEDIRSSYIQHHIFSLINGELIEELESDDFRTIIGSDMMNKEQKQKFIEQYMDSITSVLDIADKNTIEIFDNKILSENLYNYFENNLNSEDIRHLTLVQNNNLSDNDILSLIPKMGEPFNELSDDDNKIRFEINTENKDILDILHGRGIIVSFTDSKKTKGNTYYETRLRKGLSI